MAVAVVMPMVDPPILPLDPSLPLPLVTLLPLLTIQSEVVCPDPCE